MNDDVENCGVCGFDCLVDKVICCSKVCKDLVSDVKNCGGCGIECVISEVCYVSVCCIFKC